MPDFSILLGSVNARLSTAGDNLEQRAKIMNAISDAAAGLKKEYVDSPSTEAGAARGAAYHNVQQLLTHAQYPERPLAYVNDGAEKPGYEAEVDRLWKLVERVLTDKLG